jgi:hypothetical protein
VNYSTAASLQVKVLHFTSLQVKAHCKAEVSALSCAVFVMSIITWHRRASPRLELKTRPRFLPVKFVCPLTFALAKLNILCLGDCTTKLYTAIIVAVS